MLECKGFRRKPHEAAECWFEPGAEFCKRCEDKRLRYGQVANPNFIFWLREFLELPPLPDVPYGLAE